VIALLTDFGTSDTYVGVMKGVLLGICPGARLIDLTHAVQPQNVREGAFLLTNAYRYFPRNTVFLVVVDPGVGSARRGLAVQAGEYSFVAPDNGVLSYALAEAGAHQAVMLSSPAYRLAAVSNTFHGRDIFAPAAAHLAMQVPLAEFGPVVHDMVRLSQPTLSIKKDAIIGEVIHIDRFGNLITSIGRMAWSASDHLTMHTAFGVDRGRNLAIPGSATVHVHHHVLPRIERSYSSAALHQPLALVSSDGYLEIAIRQGDASGQLDVSVGDPVLLSFNSQA
jgi:hypothetical protein